MRWVALMGIQVLMGVASLPVRADSEYHLQVPSGLEEDRVRIPKNNLMSAEKVELGKQLYFDPRLSRDNTISCASCHDPQHGWSNGKRFATGVRGQVGGRSAPTIINAGYLNGGYVKFTKQPQFWDGRAIELEGQALGPIQNPIEMDMPLEEVVAKLNGIEGYRRQFQQVFGSDVTDQGIAQAIAAFERTILSGDAPFDRVKAGDESAMSESARRGMQVFFNKAHCSACHTGGNFADGGFHNIGVGIDQEEPDWGRYLVTGREGDRGSFKTPTLREIARTAPYMHDGSLETLEDVVDFYDKGGVPNPQLDEEMRPLQLTAQQKSDLVTFLQEGLSSDAYPEMQPPELPE